MTAQNDPRLITVSYRVYRVLLAAYPRQFRRAYRDEVSQLFRDCCREAQHRRGTRGVLYIWGRALLDLGVNVPREHIVQLTTRQVPPVEQTRSCSSCYSEVGPEWTVCKICGTVLNEGTTHASRPIYEVDEIERLRRHFGGMS
jgi:hypothetical protein